MDNSSNRPARRWAVFLLVLIGLAIGTSGLIYHPQTPLPKGWNPVVPFSSLHEPGPLTDWKLTRLLAEPGACRAALQELTTFETKPDYEVSDQCHIRDYVVFAGSGPMRMRPINTNCETALRLALWSHHEVQPAALRHFGLAVTGMRSQGSYNCRQIAGSTRMSHHARAAAIDIAGFRLGDGSEIELTEHWDHPGFEAFLSDIRDGACNWFGSVLGPDFNRAHADHFHLQSRGWGTCR